MLNLHVHFHFSRFLVQFTHPPTLSRPLHFLGPHAHRFIQACRRIGMDSERSSPSLTVPGDIILVAFAPTPHQDDKVEHPPHSFYRPTFSLSHLSCTCFASTYPVLCPPSPPPPAFSSPSPTYAHATCHCFVSQLPLPLITFCVQYLNCRVYLFLRPTAPPFIVPPHNTVFLPILWLLNGVLFSAHFAPYRPAPVAPCTRCSSPDPLSSLSLLNAVSLESPLSAPRLRPPANR